MNLIKLKTLLPIDDTYNGLFSNKYCYSIRNKHLYIIGGENGIDAQQYLILENGGTIEDKPYLNVSDYLDNIDEEETDRINNISLYLYRNQMIDNSIIPVELVRQFRTIIATKLLEFDYSGDSLLLNMYGYYKNNLSDCSTNLISQVADRINNISHCGCDASKQLSYVNNMSISTVTKTNCSCNNIINTNLYKDLSSIRCNILAEYKTNMRMYMELNFSELDYWKEVQPVVLEYIINYLNAINTYGLNIFDNCNTLNVEYDCRTASSISDLRSSFTYDVNNIKDAFTKIINQDYSDINFINTQLARFASIYEYMIWI